MATGKLTRTIVEAAIAGFEAQKRTIDSQIAELRSILGNVPAESTGEKPGGRGRRRFSAAARQRMREAQQARWAKLKGHEPAAKAPAKKGGITAAGRKALSEAMKKRWAAKRAAAKKA